MIDKEKISELVQHVYFDEPMKNHTTFKIGGPVDIFVEAEKAEEVINVIKYFKDNNIPYMFMGNGSNMLVSDKGIRGAVIQVSRQMNKVRIEGEKVIAEAGVMMSGLANSILQAELTGFETLSGIPGTLGGGIYMNAGAYGGEMKDVLESVTYIDEDGNIVTSRAEDLDLSYRHSIFEDRKYLILSAVLKLKKGNFDEIKAAMQDYNKRRSDKQPLAMPSAGSTFKRPEGYFAGKLIQDCNLMGYSVGGAQVSEKHAGFVVNKGNATAADVLELIRQVQEKVYEQFGVKLEPEVRLIGER